MICMQPKFLPFTNIAIKVIDCCQCYDTCKVRHCSTDIQRQPFIKMEFGSKKLIYTAFVVVQTLIFCNAQSPTKQYSSYRPNALCNPSDYVRYPQNISDVVAIVQEAISRGVTVKAFGARHSQTDIICTEGIPVDTHGLKYYQINGDGTATLGAGVTLHEATTYLRNNNLALKTTPAFGNITIAGAIGTGAHGSSIKYKSSISSQVVGMTIVDGNAIVRNITTESDLQAFRLHLGLLGFVVYVNLTTNPLYKTLAHNYEVSDVVLTNGTAQLWAQNTDQISLYWFPSSGTVSVANWTIVDVITPGNAYTYDHVPSTYANFNVLGKSLIEQSTILTQNTCQAVKALGFNTLNTMQAYMQNTLTSFTPNFVPIYTEDGQTVLNPAVGYYDLMFAPTCMDGPNGNGPLQCLWSHGEVNANITILDNEMGVSLSQLPAFITTIKDILSKAPATFVLQGILMRFSANSTSYMATAYGRDTVHFEFYLAHRNNMTTDATAGIAAFQTIMQTLAYQYGGRSHWGKSGLVYQSSPMIDLKMDPVARANFVSVMNTYDPNGVFLNNFGRRIKNISTAQDIDPANVHCALLDNCICSANSDCASYQTCTTLQGYTYKVCQTIGETALTFTPVSIPTNSSIIAWMSLTLSTLSSVVQGLLGGLACTGRGVVGLVG